MDISTGMDMLQVRSLVNQMNEESAEIDSLIHTLSAEIESAPWMGRDRERFLEEWRQRHAASLHRVADGLSGAAREANDYIRRQEEASRA